MWLVGDGGRGTAGPDGLDIFSDINDSVILGRVQTLETVAGSHQNSWGCGVSFLLPPAVTVPQSH